MNHEMTESISRQAVNWLVFFLLVGIFTIAAIWPESIGSMAGKVIHAYNNEILGQ